nr:MAG TPA: hypothetical protein [Herelleviridae sp.]
MILAKGINSICNTRPAVRMFINFYCIVGYIYKTVTFERTSIKIRRGWGS